MLIYIIPNIHKQNNDMGGIINQTLRAIFIESFLEMHMVSFKKILAKYQGAVSIRKTVLPGMAIPMLKIRRPNGRLIFNMEITIRR